LNFASSGFSVSGAEFVTYEITYAWDPSDIRSLDDVLLVDSPVAPGLAKIDTTGCKGAKFTPLCGTSTVSLTVFHDGITFVPFASAPIVPPETILGVRNVITLEANGAAADFASFENHIVLPEPAALWLTAPVLAWLGRRRLKRG
jgi:hypothetical protein